MRLGYLIALASASALTPTAAYAADVVTYNGTPFVGYHYGHGNDYAPANSVIDTSGFGNGGDGSQLYDRWHANGGQAPASDANGVYSFAKGISTLSFDFGFTAPPETDIRTWALTNAMVTLTNIGTGQTYSYNPYAATDNYFGNNSLQNSEQLNFFPAIGFDGNVDDTYSLVLSANGHSFISYAKVGDGAPMTAAVPEPATWGMMILGFGLMGFIMRKRSYTHIVRYEPA